MIGESLSYAREQITSSYIPVFSYFSCSDSYSDEEVLKATRCIDDMLNKIQSILASDLGVIITNK